MKLYKSTLITFITSMSVACGGLDAQTSSEDSIISQDGQTQIIPGLDGNPRNVETLSFSVQNGRVLWRVRVDGLRYQILAEGGAEPRISVSQSGAELFSINERDGALSVQGAGEGGILGATYPSAPLSQGTPALTQQHIQGLRDFAQTVVPVADSFAVSLATIGLAEYIDHTIDNGETEPQGLAALAGILNFIKKVGEFIGQLFGGGSAEPGLDCPGGSSAQCESSTGSTASVVCSTCTARCTEIFGAAGSTCSCSCF